MSYMKKSIATVLLIVPLSVSLAKARIADASTSSNEYFYRPYPQSVAQKGKVVISQLLSQYQPYEQECFALYRKAQFASKKHRYYIHSNKEIEELTYIPPSYGRESCSRSIVGTLNSPGVYTIWRIEGNSLVFAQLSGDDKSIMGTRRGVNVSPSQATSQAGSTTASGMSQRSLIGKVWEIDLGSGKSGLRYLFCNSMRYEIHGRTFLGGAGRYSTDGNYLTTRREDGEVESFNLRWGSSSVELVNRSSGKVVRRLYYYATAKC